MPPLAGGVRRTRRCQSWLSGTGPSYRLSLAIIERLAATLGVSLSELFAPFTDKPALPT